MLQLIPIITDETRAAWEEYSSTHQAWLHEARVYQAEKGIGEGIADPVSSLATTVINPVILRIDENADGYLDPGVSVKEEK